MKIIYGLCMTSLAVLNAMNDESQEWYTNIQKAIANSDLHQCTALIAEQPSIGQLPELQEHAHKRYQSRWSQQERITTIIKNTIGSGLFIIPAASFFGLSVASTSLTGALLVQSLRLAVQKDLVGAIGGMGLFVPCSSLLAIGSFGASNIFVEKSTALGTASFHGIQSVRKTYQARKIEALLRTIKP